MTIGLPHVDRFEDRNGHWRYYFRRKGEKRIPIAGEPGSAEFIASYHDARTTEPQSTTKQRTRGADGSFDRLCFLYYDSTKFRRNKASTQTKTRGILDRFCEAHGHRLVRQLTPEKAEHIVAAKADTPAGANNLLKAMRVLMKFAIKSRWRTDDPFAGIERFKEGTYHTWDENELAQFEAHWPLGTTQRTAYALALYTGQRRSDLARMTWRSYSAKLGTIEVAQEKTDMERRDERLTIPVHAGLREALEVWPQRNVMILATSYGKAFSVDGFGNMMAKAISAAGLPERCVLHGLRKAAARRLAEAGCTSKQIAAITGHKSLDEIERYTRGAEQKLLARSAVAKLERHGQKGWDQPA
jgi:integrase